MFPRVPTLASIALTSLSLACVPGSYHTATPIAEGSLELGGALGIGGYSSEPDEYYDLIDTSSLTFLMYDVFLRYGLATWSDVGLQFNYAGASGGSVRADFNVNLINTQTFALSIDPAVQVLGTQDYLQRLSGTAGIFIDFHKTQSTIYSLNLKPGYDFTASRVMAGGGFLARHIWSEKWVAMPFVDLNWLPDADEFLFEYHFGVAFAYTFN